MKFLYTDQLERGMILGRDIISPALNIMLKAGMVFTDDYIAYLKKKGYLGAYITDEDSRDIVVEDAISTKTLMDSIIAVEKADVESLMQSAQLIVSDISKMKKLSIDIVDLRSFDDYTYHHSVNVAVYAVAVGKFMGMTDKELKELCQAGICHDLGKQRIPIEILNKPGSLTDEEFAEIKKHPQYSYEILKNNPDVSSSVRQAVLCHHENENGSGYPLGKEGNQLQLMARILHAVDVYDALTSRRPYKAPYAPVDAFEYLMGGIDILFNEAVVLAMRKVIPAYPIATEVKLSTGEMAIVVDHTEDPLRPVVRSLDTKKLINLFLSENSDILIESSAVMTMDYAGAVEKLNESRLTVKERPLDIMLVDDSFISLQQTTGALKDDRYHIIALQSGLAALNYIKEKGVPDLLIMDIEMPVLDGVKTVSRIREMGFKDLPVIFLTAKGDRETVLRCKAVNAKDYIIKPVRPTYLKGRVDVSLDASLER